MSLAADIRLFHGERCGVAEIAEYLRVPAWYVRQVLGMPKRAGNYGRRRVVNVVAEFNAWVRAA